MQNTASNITYLATSFQEKELVKRLGAKWDAVAKKWYVPADTDLEPFNAWLPIVSEENIDDTTDDNRIGLAKLLTDIAAVIAYALPTNIWIKAEISQLRRMGEHLAIELVEHDSNALLIARAQSFLWQYNVANTLAKFKSATGFDLTAGIKAMLLVKTEFNATHGVRLIIQDIDPSYTLGDIEAKRRYIRDTLNKAAILTNNQQLAPPQEFCCVAVISPENAAGLGDFKRDADYLKDFGLCEFDYFAAKFQGATAATDIQNSLLTIFDRQQKTNKYDAICIIRGGGSITDLYWLNDLELARTVCLSRLPILTGIGHERDNTILDEIANRRFDTPSKVIAHIRELICANAQTAATHYQQVMLSSQQQIAQAEQSIEQFAVSLQTLAHRVLSTADHQVAQNLRVIESKTDTVLANSEIQLTHLQDRIRLDAFNWLASANTRSEQSYQLVLQQGQQQLERATHHVEAFGKEILGISPYATLNRGFAIVRNSRNMPIVSATQAKQQTCLTIQFRDGIVTVQPKPANRGHDDKTI